VPKEKKNITSDPGRKGELRRKSPRLQEAKQSVVMSESGEGQVIMLQAFIRERAGQLISPE